jgi:hypothetical protein
MLTIVLVGLLFINLQLLMHRISKMGLNRYEQAKILIKRRTQNQAMDCLRSLQTVHCFCVLFMLIDLVLYVHKLCKLTAPKHV